MVVSIYDVQLFCNFISDIYIKSRRPARSLFKRDCAAFIFRGTVYFAFRITRNKINMSAALLSPRYLFGGAISLNLPQNSIDARSVVLNVMNSVEQTNKKN